MTADEALLQRARSGDGQAFAGLVQPYRRELHVHCYRMLGSFDDADDALQETLLAAWRGLTAFQARASVRTWHGSGLLVITPRGSQVCGLTRFESHTLKSFGMPSVLDGDGQLG
jgi:hypothetical protein